MLVEIRWTASNLNTQRRSLETGAAFGLIPTAELLHGIAPADHELKITDLELAGISLREQLIRSMTQLANELVGL